MRVKISEGRNRCSRKHGGRTSPAAQWLGPLLLGAAEGLRARQPVQSPDALLQLAPHRVGLARVASLSSTGPSRTERRLHSRPPAMLCCCLTAWTPEGLLSDC